MTAHRIAAVIVRRRRVLFAGALAAVAALAALRAAVAQDATAAVDATRGVFVRDSAVAADKLKLGERMEQAKQWDTAADLYQEVLDGYADRVVPTHSDAAGRPDRFGSVTTILQDRIAGWPAEGLDVYVARHETAARQALDAAGADRRALAGIVTRYFVTAAGRDAALALAESYFDAGELPASARLCDRLLDHHPRLDDATRAMLLARSAVAWSLAGEAARAAARLDALAKKYPDQRAAIGGDDATLASAVGEAVRRPSGSVAAATVARDWLVPFGSDDHVALAAEPEGVDPSVRREWARWVTVPVESSAAQAGLDGSGEETLPLRDQRERGISTGILPSLDASTLYFQDNAAVHAIDLATGRPPEAWRATYPEGGRYRLTSAVPMPRGAQLAVTVAGERVLSILSQRDVSTRNASEDAVVPARIVCLDRATGKLRWQFVPAEVDRATLAPADAADAAAPAPAAEPGVVPNVPAPRQPNGVGIVGPAAAPPPSGLGDPSGSVIVAGDSAYCVMRGGRAGGFTDASLVALDLATGKPRWIRALASGNAPFLNPNDDANVQGDSADSHLAYADGRLYVSTDLGALASVSAADGTIDWISLYPRPAPDPIAANPWRFNGMANANGRVPPAYSGNPVIVRDGRVISLPTDGDNLFVHDAATGRPIVRVPLKRRIEDGQRTDRLDVLVGLSGDHLVLSSSWAITVLDYAKLLAGDAKPDANANANAAAEGRVASIESVLINHRPLNSNAYPESAIRGRPFLTTNSLYVPTAQCLYRLTDDARRVVDRYPDDNGDLSGRADEQPGNLVAVGNALAVAGTDSVSVYVELGKLRRRLDAAVAAAPGEVGPPLDYARVMFDTRRFDEALRWLDAAIAATKPPAAALPTPGPERDRVYDAAMEMLARLDADASASGGAGRATPVPVASDRPIPPSDRPFAKGLLERLASLAETPGQRVSAALARGSVSLRSGDDAGAVQAYQSLLDDPALAALDVRRGDLAGAAGVGSGVPVATVARQAIEAIVARDADAYAAVETRAAEEVARLRERGDLAGLIATIDRYPNSRATREALAQAAAGAGGQDRPDAAVLRRLGGQSLDARQRVPLERALYALAVSAGDDAAALGRARRLAQLAPGEAMPTTRPGDATEPPEAAIARLQARVFDAADAALPDLRANLADAPSFDAGRAGSLENVAAILAPDDDAAAQPGRLLAVRRGDRKLLIFEAGQVAPAFELDAPRLIDAARVEWSGDRAWLAQPTQVTCVDAAAGKVAWTRTRDELFGAGGTTAAAGGGASVAVISPALAPPGIDLGRAVAAGADDSSDAAMLARIDAQIQRSWNRPNANGNVQRLMIQRQQIAQRMLVNRRGGGGRVLVDVDPGDGAAEGWAVSSRVPAGDTESILRAIPAADGGCVLFTNRGRIAGLSPAGELRWQARLGDRPAGRALGVAGGRLVAAFVTDDRASRLVVLDAVTGRESLRREYASTDPRKRIVNLAADGEGFLCVVHAGGTSVFDAADGAPDPIGAWAASEAALPFAASTNPRHVAIAGGHLLVAAGVPAGEGSDDPAVPSPYVRVIELPSGQPTRVPGTPTLERRLLPTALLGNREGGAAIRLRAHRDAVLLDNGVALASLGVTDGVARWSRILADAPTSLTGQSPAFVKGGVALVAWPRDLLGQTSPTATLELYSREKLENGRESGMLIDELPLGPLVGATPPADARRLSRPGVGPRLIDRVAFVNGGVYLLSNAGRLVFLPGAKP